MPPAPSRRTTSNCGNSAATSATEGASNRALALGPCCVSVADPSPSRQAGQSPAGARAGNRRPQAWHVIVELRGPPSLPISSFMPSPEAIPRIRYRVFCRGNREPGTRSPRIPKSTTPPSGTGVAGLLRLLVIFEAIPGPALRRVPQERHPCRRRHKSHLATTWFFPSRRRPSCAFPPLRLCGFAALPSLPVRKGTQTVSFAVQQPQIPEPRVTR